MEYLRSICICMVTAKDYSMNMVIEMCKFHPYILLLSIIGSMYLLSKTLKIVNFFYRYFVRSGIDLKKRYGSGWAVVTGASAGIGLAYAKYLAGKGFKILLISNEKDLIQSLSEEIAADYNVATRGLYFDFDAPCEEEAYSPIIETVRDITERDSDGIAILCNNVGIGQFERFEDSLLNKQRSILNINAGACTMMTRIIIPFMQGRTLNKSSGGILFVSSMARYLHLPFMPLYSATKAYVHALASTVAMEYRGVIDLLCLTPSGVTTRLNPATGSLNITPSLAAISHFKSLGVETETDGHWKHELQRNLMEYLSENKIKKRVSKGLGLIK